MIMKKKIENFLTISKYLTSMFLKAFINKLWAAISLLLATAAVITFLLTVNASLLPNGDSVVSLEYSSAVMPLLIAATLLPAIKLLWELFVKPFTRTEEWIEENSKREFNTSRRNEKKAAKKEKKAAKSKDKHSRKKEIHKSNMDLT